MFLYYTMHTCWCFRSLYLLLNCDPQHHLTGKYFAEVTDFAKKRLTAVSKLWQSCRTKSTAGCGHYCSSPCMTMDDLPMPPNCPDEKIYSKQVTSWETTARYCWLWNKCSHYSKYILSNKCSHCSRFHPQRQSLYKCILKRITLESNLYIYFLRCITL